MPAVHPKEGRDRPAIERDRRKQARLQAAAGHYLLAHSADRACRFDVVAVSGRDARIEWLRDAFGADH